MGPPPKPPFTDALKDKKSGGNTPKNPAATNPFLEELDKLSGQELADYLYALAEEIIASPQEYKIKMGLEQLDIAELDNIDLSTAAGRRKLAKLLRLLAEQALRGKEVYLGSVIDKDKDKQQGRGR